MMSVQASHRKETSLCCRLTYRSISGADALPGEGVCLTGDEIRFLGHSPLSIGVAAEVCIEAVKGMSPPLKVYIEVARCEKAEAGGYLLTGIIKGIRSL